MRKQKDGANAYQNAGWWRPDRHADRRPLLLARNSIKAAFRSFLEAESFTEVECGQVQLSPGNETHLHAMAVRQQSPDGDISTRYLHTSPEFAMKKLIAGVNPGFLTLRAFSVPGNGAPFMRLNSPCSNGIGQKSPMRPSWRIANAYSLWQLIRLARSALNFGAHSVTHMKSRTSHRCGSLRPLRRNQSSRDDARWSARSRSTI